MTKNIFYYKSIIETCSAAGELKQSDQYHKNLAYTKAVMQDYVQRGRSTLFCINLNHLHHTKEAQEILNLIKKDPIVPLVRQTTVKSDIDTIIEKVVSKPNFNPQGDFANLCRALRAFDAITLTKKLEDKLYPALFFTQRTGGETSSQDCDSRDTGYYKNRF